MAKTELRRGKNMVVMYVKDPLVANNSSIRSLSIAQALTRQGFQVAVVADSLSTSKGWAGERMAKAWQQVTSDRGNLLNGAKTEATHYFFAERRDGNSFARTLSRLLPGKNHRGLVAALLAAYPTGRDIVEGSRKVLGENVNLVADCAALDELSQYQFGATYDAFGVRTSNPAHETINPGYLVQFNKAAFVSQKSIKRTRDALQQAVSARAGQPEFLRALGPNGRVDENLMQIDRVSKFAEVTTDRSSADHSRLDQQVTEALGLTFEPSLSRGDLGRSVGDNTGPGRPSDYALAR